MDSGIGWHTKTGSSNAAGNYTVDNPYLKNGEGGWTSDSKGLRYYLNEMYARYNLSKFIVENGLGTIDEIESNNQLHDDYRISYLKDHIKQMIKTIDDGVDVIGFDMWSPIDLLSFVIVEMKKRYVLIYIDLDDHGKGGLNRIRKDFFYWYKKVIETKGQEL